MIIVDNADAASTFKQLESKNGAGQSLPDNQIVIHDALRRGEALVY